MRCIDNIKDIILDCDYKPKKGLKHKVLVIPYKDIDRRYTTLNTDKTEITHLQLLPSKRGYLFELNNAFKVSGSQKFGGGFTHELSIKIDKADSGNIATMNALTKGTYVLVVETASNTFEVLGYEAGLVVNSVQRDYAGNVIGLVFATPSDVKELRMVALWGEGDYLTMSKKFEKKVFMGRNLIKNSKKIVTKVEAGGIAYIGDFVLEIGKTYIISAKKITGARSDNMFYLNTNKDWGLGQSKSVLVNTEFVVDKDYKYLWIWGNNSGDEVTIENLKIEKGNTPTDWCPADED